MSQRKNFSEVWDHFDKVENVGKAVCKVCRESYSYKSTIANLKNHLKRKHLSTYLSLSSQVQKCESELHHIPMTSQPASGSTEPIPSTSAAAASAIEPLPAPQVFLNSGIKRKRQNVIDSYVPKKISKDQKQLIDRDVLELCIDSFHTFSIVEERSFIKLMRWIPGYTLPSRKTLSNSHLNLLYNSTKQKLKPQLDADCDTICITLDFWTSRKTESYLAVTGHYINREFELKTILLDCCSFPGHHTAVNIAAELRLILDDYNLAHKVNFAVSDNAANVTNAVKDHLGWKHYGCYAHSLNLVLQDSVEIFNDSLTKVKKIVAFFHKSTSASEKLNQQQVLKNKTPKRLIQSVDTRWNSTYFMIKRIIELKDEVKITMALLNNNLPIISEEEWSLFSDLNCILKPFDEITACMSGEKYVTASDVIVVTRILKHSLENFCGSINFNNEKIQQFLHTLQHNFNRRLGNVEKSGTFSLCTFLDPRYKMAAFSDQTNAENTKRRVLTYVQELIARKWQPPTAEINPSSSSSNNDTAWNIFDKFMSSTVTNQQGTPLSKAIKEVQMFVDDDILPRKDPSGKFNNPQAWWYCHRHIYPNLADIYRTNCNMVATSVSCERIFSKTGQIISDRRASLKTDKEENGGERESPESRSTFVTTKSVEDNIDSSILIVEAWSPAGIGQQQRRSNQLSGSTAPSPVKGAVIVSGTDTSRHRRRAVAPHRHVVALFVPAKASPRPPVR
ncbi:E3 SUMO-protein ligase ZBED1-like [Vanessa atalanta]|uniref:E3 SUMO-protein ligase ZBED1-like n=1 Tax=Vanessa atalanta TaxID=42275 RepID=UPI001FCDA809|nr:E3 SUMO-protein ligase ZBED1-like [Vanessa atalanta]